MMIYSEILKQNKKHPYLVFVSCNDAYAFCLYVSLATFIKNSPLLAQDSDIVIASYGISEKNKKVLSSLPNVFIFEYEFPYTLKDSMVLKKFTVAAFSRYECFGLLDTYQKIIYLDSDILVQKELNSVFDNLTEGLALTCDKTVATIKFNFFRDIPGFDMSVKGYNSGIIFFQNKGDWILKGKQIRQWLYDMSVKYEEFLSLPDQGILNLAIRHFNIPVTEIPLSYNCPTSENYKEKKQAYIIHSLGYRKFWQYYYFGEWYKEYVQWIKKGGDPVRVRKLDSKVYKKFIQTLKLDRFVFFQLCPDFFKFPMNAVRFFFKKLFGTRF